ALRVDLEHLAARGAAQLVLVRALDTGLADLVAEGIGLGALPVRVELFLRDRADVAEHVRRGAAEWVRADGRLLHRYDVCKQVVVLGEVQLERLRDVVGDRHRQVRAVARVDETVLDERAVDRMLRHVPGDLGGEAVDDLRVPAVVVLADVREALLVDRDDDRDAVVDEHDAVAIEDAAAGRLLEDRARLERGGRGLELLGRHHLQVPEAREQRREERHDQDPEPQAGVVVVHRHAAARRPRVSAGSAQRTTRSIGSTSTEFSTATTAATVSRCRSRKPSRPSIFASRPSTTTPSALPASAVSTGIHQAARSTVAFDIPTTYPVSV